jgi:hypothetical protein
MSLARKLLDAFTLTLGYVKRSRWITLHGRSTVKLNLRCGFAGGSISTAAQLRLSTVGLRYMARHTHRGGLTLDIEARDNRPEETLFVEARK